MKSLLSFLQTTIAGGILFLLPFGLLVIVVIKVHGVIIKISTPLARHLPDLVLGFDGSQLVAILILILLCFFCGLLFRFNWVKKAIGKMEDKVLSLMPGYSLMKSITADAVGEHIENNLSTVLVKDADAWKIGFLVEEDEKYSTVFFPEAPRHDSGEVMIIPSSKVRKVDVPANKASLSLKSYGRGIIEMIKTTKE